jgi:hypothetical protein
MRATGRHGDGAVQSWKASVFFLIGTVAMGSAVMEGRGRVFFSIGTVRIVFNSAVAIPVILIHGDSLNGKHILVD